MLYRQPFMFEPDTEKRTIFFGRSEPGQFENWPRLYPYLSRRANDKRRRSRLKRAMDIAGSVLALIIAAPVFAAIAIAIKATSEGPVFFRQRRIGQHGRHFVFLKFRSMRVSIDATAHKEYVKRLISGQAERHQSNGNGQGVFKLTADPHITKVGAFLRKTSLDELPQFINVLNGDVSLVGPRPLLPYEVEEWHRRQSTPPVDPPSFGDPYATVCAPLRPKPAPRSGAISLPEPNDTEDSDPGTSDKANGRPMSVGPPKTFISANHFAR